MTRTKNAFLALVAVLLAPMAANADIITLTGAGANDGDWEISYLEGTFSDLLGILSDQVWWGDSTLALNFAQTLGEVPGVSNVGNLWQGPLFATSYGENSVSYAAWHDGSYPSLNEQAYLATTYWSQYEFHGVWAIAQRVSVPEPGTLVLLGLGLLGMGAVRHRKAV